MRKKVSHTHAAYQNRGMEVNRVPDPVARTPFQMVQAGDAEPHNKPGHAPSAPGAGSKVLG